MNPANIFCGICGKAEPVSLLQHVRDEHSLTPEAYQQRCPNAPLFTPEFGEYLKTNRIHIENGAVKAVRELTIADNGGEIVTPHPDFRLVATANTLGLGDEDGLYTGTSVLNASHLDRWTAVFQINYLNGKEETSVIMDKVPGLPASQVTGFINLATAVRKAVEEEELFMTFSTRRLLALARKTKSLGVDKALEVTVLNKLPKTDRAVVAELAQRHLPGLSKKTA